MVKLVKPLHISYLQLVVYQFVLIKTVEKWLREFNGVWKRRRFNVFNFRKPQKNVKMCSFCWLMWIVSSIVIQNCDRLSQLYIEDIRLLMCKFADDDNTILIIRVWLRQEVGITNYNPMQSLCWCTRKMDFRAITLKRKLYKFAISTYNIELNTYKIVW